jgi:peptide/nickel transport system permease protein
MPAFVIRRIAGLVPLLVLFSAFLFVLIRLAPGDPATFFMPAQGGDPAARDKIVAQLGLDKPVPVQYVLWLSSLVRGDLGFSWTYGQPVTEIIAQRLGASAQLWLATMIFALVLAVPIGILSAVKRNSIFDVTATLVSFLGISLPDFWLGLMLLLLFALTLGWLPTSGMGDDLPVLGRAAHFVLPVLVLGTQLLPWYVRFLRSSVLEVLTKDYVATARAKGLSEGLVLGRHVLSNALLPMVTIIGLSVPRFVGGAVIVESIFAWPGIGRLALDGALRRDYPIVMGLIVVTFVFVVLTNLVTDLIYMRLDPRISFDRSNVNR